MTATILLVDDEKNARNNIGTYLESEGYEVLLAADLKTARKHHKLPSGRRYHLSSRASVLIPGS